MMFVAKLLIAFPNRGTEKNSLHLKNGQKKSGNHIV
jgi:hypothetical protein